MSKNLNGAISAPIYDLLVKDLCDTFTEEEAREQLDWILPHMERIN